MSFPSKISLLVLLFLWFWSLLWGFFFKKILQIPPLLGYLVAGILFRNAQNAWWSERKFEHQIPSGHEHLQQHTIESQSESQPIKGYDNPRGPKPSSHEALPHGSAISHFSHYLADGGVLEIPFEISALVRSLGLASILLVAGLEIDFSKIRQMGWMCLRLTVLPGVSEACTVGFLSYLIFGMRLPWGMVLGFILGAVSPAVVCGGMFSLQKKGYGVAKAIPSLVVCAASLDDVVAISGFTTFIGLAMDSINIETIGKHELGKSGSSLLQSGDKMTGTPALNSSVGSSRIMGSNHIFDDGLDGVVGGSKGDSEPTHVLHDVDGFSRMTTTETSRMTMTETDVLKHGGDASQRSQTLSGHEHESSLDIIFSALHGPFNLMIGGGIGIFCGFLLAKLVSGCITRQDLEIENHITLDNDLDVDVVAEFDVEMGNPVRQIQVSTIESPLELDVSNTNAESLGSPNLATGTSPNANGPKNGNPGSNKDGDAPKLQTVIGRPVSNVSSNEATLQASHLVPNNSDQQLSISHASSTSSIIEHSHAGSSSGDGTGNGQNRSPVRGNVNRANLVANRNGVPPRLKIHRTYCQSCQDRVLAFLVLATGFGIVLICLAQEISGAGFLACLFMTCSFSYFLIPDATENRGSSPGSGRHGTARDRMIHQNRDRHRILCLQIKEMVLHNLTSVWDYLAEPLLFAVIGSVVNLKTLNLSLLPKASFLILFCVFLIRVPAAMLAVRGATSSGVSLSAREKLFVGLSWMPKATVQAALGSVPLDKLKMKIKQHVEREMGVKQTELFDENHKREFDRRINLYRDHTIEYKWSQAIVTTAVLSILITAPIGLLVVNKLGPRMLSRD